MGQQTVNKYILIFPVLQDVSPQSLTLLHPKSMILSLLLPHLSDNFPVNRLGPWISQEPGFTICQDTSLKSADFDREHGDQ